MTSTDLNAVVKCKSQDFVTGMPSSDLSDPPPCKRPLLLQPTTMHPNLECDKYACKASNLELPQERFSLRNFHLQKEQNNSINIDDQKEIFRSSEAFSKYNTVKSSLKVSDTRDDNPGRPAVGQRSESFKNINHVCILFQYLNENIE